MRNSINKLREISTIDKVGILVGIFFISPMAFIILKHIIINGAIL